MMVQIVPKHVAVTNSVTICVTLTCVLLDNKDRIIEFMNFLHRPI
jgi:hypothetical protein